MWEISSYFKSFAKFQQAQSQVHADGACRGDQHHGTILLAAVGQTNKPLW